jgi:hypothetical protein
MGKNQNEGGKVKADGFNEFLTEYKAAKIPENEKPINSSKYTLKQQLKRFIGFSHSKNESETLLKEARTL